MLSLDILRVSTRSFKNNRLRTFLTVLGIGIGIGAILFLVSLGYGFQKLILEKIANSDSLLSLDVTAGESEAVKLTKESLADLETIPGVIGVSPVAIRDTQIFGGGFVTDCRVNLANQEYFKLEGISLKQGRFFEPASSEVVVSSATMKLLEFSEDDFSGKKIKLKLFNEEEEKRGSREDLFFEQGGLEYEIVGIVDDDFTAYAYVPIDSVDFSFSYYDKMKVKVSSEDQLALAREKIIERGYYVSAISDIVEQAKQIFNVAQIVLALFGVVALVVSAIGMFNTMTIALLERTQEIGIMKSLGASSFDIWRLFLAESMIIGFSGGVLGLGLGYGLSQLVGFGINQLAKNLGGVQVDLFFTPAWFVIFVVVFSSLVGFVTGFYPARRASKLNPLEALRYK